MNEWVVCPNCKMPHPKNARPKWANPRRFPFAYYDDPFDYSPGLGKRYFQAVIRVFIGALGWRRGELNPPGACPFCHVEMAGQPLPRRDGPRCPRCLRPCGENGKCSCKPGTAIVVDPTGPLDKISDDPAVP